MSVVLRLLAALAVFLVGGFAAQARVDVRVDIAAQRMTVTTSDGETYNWTISSGRTGFRSPNGVYRPTRLERDWYSRKYGGAMPHSIFFRGGYAIHGTTAVGALGRPASHGCIRLHPANAAKLFALVKKHGAAGTRIALHGAASDSLSRFAKAGTTKPRKPVAAKVEAKMSAPLPAARVRVAEPSFRGEALTLPARGSSKARVAAGKRVDRNAIATGRSTGWETARERVLLRPALPAGAYGYQPYQGPIRYYYEAPPYAGWR